MHIAIVGSGISGLLCAHLLHPQHDITIFEANHYPGGHANTVIADDPTGPQARRGLTSTKESQVR